MATKERSTRVTGACRSRLPELSGETGGFSEDFISNFVRGSVAYLDRIHLMNETPFYSKLLALPDGASYVRYKERRYLLRKETLLGGKVLKLYAEALGSNDIVSGNYYPTLKGGMLKPCEMSERKVIDFVLHAQSEDIPKTTGQ